ncbi:unnamed protein product [Adineta steineri]|uniref:Condensation domain-containing protein n=1 Tax=Adineta steineri TaxID=433720 RepID=A0A815D657_9BILA|nr:unnamed protein product [Adineta steineri]CAF3874078.1 unnamed protein product [Adineta steineri]
MTTSREFWYLQLEGYNLEHQLSLPVDRHRLSNEHRSSSASVTHISFDNEISQLFLDYASIHYVTPFQLGLTILNAFLFKLTHDKNDLCVSCLNANRYKTELQNIMGMFVSTLPYRVQLDPHSSFDDLVEYSDELSLDGTSFKPVSFEQPFEVAKFDFMLTFIYNSMLENNKLSFRLTCSHDLFDEITVTNVGRRLEYCFQQLFSSNETISEIDTCFTSISKFDLILPEETQEMEYVIFCRQSHMMNEGMFV